jgi:hypothetical protein
VILYLHYPVIIAIKINDQERCHRPCFEIERSRTIMDTTAEKSLMASILTDVRQAPLGRLSAPETLDRLRPAESGKVAVAAFNASL